MTTPDYGLKLIRADDHLQRLNGLIDKFLDSKPKPYRMSVSSSHLFPIQRPWLSRVGSG